MQQNQRYQAEFLGTFVLSFVVWLSTLQTMPASTPVVAALTLGVLVYTLGGISGAQLNPAVTLGMLAIKKISPRDAAYYVLCQLLGGAAVALIAMLMEGSPSVAMHDGSPVVALGEALGAFVLAFGVASVVRGKVHAAASGLTVGLSLFLGICFASPFSMGFLNPAVALGSGFFEPMYIIGPLLGGAFGAVVYNWLAGAERK